MAVITLARRRIPTWAVSVLAHSLAGQYLFASVVPADLSVALLCLPAAGPVTVETT